MGPDGTDTQSFTVPNPRGTLLFTTRTSVRTTEDNRMFHTGGFRQSGGGLEENRLKRCHKVVKVTEGRIHARGGGGGFF